MSIFAATIPVTSWLALNFTTGLLLTVPLRYRLCFLPAILVPATISFRTIQYLDFAAGLSELWGTITFIGLIHFFSLLYITKWTIPTSLQARRDLPSAIWANKSLWKCIYRVATNPRSSESHTQVSYCFGNANKSIQLLYMASFQQPKSCGWPSRLVCTSFSIIW